MWLLNTTTLTLREFYSDLPPYAILSHTWVKEEEVLFHELGTAECKRKEGYRKIKHCCAQAKADGLEYAWVDTCCIDTRSSSELSESINSMFRWYSEAHVCYAYLSDVANDSSSRSLEHSRWWTRGWTLQELLAPIHVVFYDKSWLEIGTKMSMLDKIVLITGISRPALSNPAVAKYQCAAEKMLWASRRETTRVEDTAYCLIGIFGISMPLVYGEGSGAFERLQLEILKRGDLSILAWTSDGIARNQYGMDLYPILARSPADFSSTSIGRGEEEETNWLWHDTSVSINSLALSISMPIITEAGQPWIAGELCTSMIGILNCQRDGRFVGIHLYLAPDNAAYMRQYPNDLFLVKESTPLPSPQRVYLSTWDYFPARRDALNIQISIHCVAVRKHSYRIVRICNDSGNPMYSSEPSHSQQSLWRVNLATKERCLVLLHNSLNSWFSLTLGNFEQRVWSHGVIGDLSQDFPLNTMPIWKGIQQCLWEERYASQHFNDRATYNVHGCTLSVKLDKLPRPRSPSDTLYFKVEITQPKHEATMSPYNKSQAHGVTYEDIEGLPEQLSRLSLN
ncbi:hypothetical protein PV04_00491 [Phialophora macrospora]|uniref:Heterokaryon incompatibility domain-containing protein n=1 Tax=Phialophora macrospora TaxID=1851006 RepID=A0A0D2D3X9_9EURO|nr:hypothetical protein PV04_00491 [Phialophora macrospora]